MTKNLRKLLGTSAGLLLVGAACAAAYEELGGAFEGSLDHPAIGYAQPSNDVVARLNRRLADGSAELKYDAAQGSYLRSVLQALHVPVESQIVAMSKTSVQQGLISPQNPRTLYFNDSVAVGYVRGGFMEAAAQDPKQGVVFYTMLRDRQPVFRREDRCLECHLSYDTMGVPGTLLRSVFPQPDGSVLPQTARYPTDHRSPFAQRYGGWFVTGESGPARHLGNSFFTDPDKADAPAKGQLLKTLAGRLDPKLYLSPYSDVVALQVFDHQMHMMNLLTRMGWEARYRKAEQPAELAVRMQGAAEEFVDYLLFVDEAPLMGTIRGNSGFAEKFAAEGPFDSQGRSLRQFDLKNRLMRYPCSYMIYSEAFDSLPPEAKDAIYRRLWAVLSGQVSGGKYARLSSGDRRAVAEILHDTKQGLPDYFAARAPAVRILTPKPDASVASGYIALTADAPPGSCWSITLDGAGVSKACAAADGLVQRVVRLRGGPHELTLGDLSGTASVSVMAQGLESAPKVAVNWDALQEGDIILAHSSGHDQADLFDPVYTHAALYLGPDANGAPLVLEALSGDLAEGLGEVRALPLERTWLYRDAVRVDIYRLAREPLPEQRAAILKFGREIAARHLPYRSTSSFADLYSAWLLWDPAADRPRNAERFDAALERLRDQKETTQSFDCATLVWRAYEQAHVDIGESSQVTLRGRLAGALSPKFLARIQPYFLSVDSLAASAKLVQVTHR